MSTIGKFTGDLVKALVIAIMTVAIGAGIGYTAMILGQVLR